MLPAVAKKLHATNKEKSHRKVKDKRHNKHKLKSKSIKHIEPAKITVQYSDVSSEELSSPEAGEIHSDYEEKYCRISFKSKKIITDNLLITTRVSPRIESPCSPLNDHWNKNIPQENFIISTNMSLNNCVNIASEVKPQKTKKSKKANKKRKSPGSKRKKKKKELKRIMLLEQNNSNVNPSKCSNLELSKRNGVFSESVKKHTHVEEESHTPPLMKSSSKISKAEEVKHSKHLKKEDKR